MKYTRPTPSTAKSKRPSATVPMGNSGVSAVGQVPEPVRVRQIPARVEGERSQAGLLPGAVHLDVQLAEVGENPAAGRAHLRPVVGQLGLARHQFGQPDSHGGLDIPAMPPAEVDQDLGHVGRKAAVGDRFGGGWVTRYGAAISSITSARAISAARARVTAPALAEGLYAGTDDGRGQLTVLRKLGVVRMLTGDYQAAADLLQRALAPVPQER